GAISLSYLSTPPAPSPTLFPYTTLFRSASSKGLGRACARSLAEAGCEVVVNGRNRDAVESAAADIRQRTGAKVTAVAADVATAEDRKSTRLNSSHQIISYAVFCLKKKKQ